MIAVLFIAVSILLSVSAESSNDEQNCINDIIKWCASQDFRSNGHSSSVSSSSDNDSFQVIRCVSNSRGANCSKNGSPFLRCSLNHKATYKGTVLRENSITGADDEICVASRSISDNHQQTSIQISRMRQANDAIFRDCFPFCNFNPFGK